MVTNVVCRERGISGDWYFKFKNSKWGFELNGFENGVATVEPELSSDIREFISNIVGCLNEESNFISEIRKVYHFEEIVELQGILFIANGAKVLVTKDFMDEERVFRKWRAAMEKPSEEDYSFKSLRRRAKMLKAIMRAEVVEENAIKAVKQEELCFKDEEAKKIWEQWVDDYTSEGYTHSIVSKTERWAKYMQYLKKKHNVDLKYVAEVAFDVINIRDDKSDGYEMVMILEKCWIYGEELNKWFKNYIYSLMW